MFAILAFWLISNKIFAAVGCSAKSPFIRGRSAASTDSFVEFSRRSTTMILFLIKRRLFGNLGKTFRH